MRLNTIFWGIMLICLGVLFLLNSLGILQVNLWGILLPMLLIFLGVWILLGVVFNKRKLEHAAVALENARQARIELRHGAGHITIRSGAQAGSLLEGDFAGGIILDEHRNGEQVSLSLAVKDQFFAPFSFGAVNTLDWDLRLADSLPIELELKTGASDNRIDLSDLKVSLFHLDTGASSTELDLPAQAGFTRAEIHSGAASVTVRVPHNVAARIRYQANAATVSIDPLRFPKSGAYYQSQDYESGENKADLMIETGAGSVEVR